MPIDPPPSPTKSWDENSLLVLRLNRKQQIIDKRINMTPCFDWPISLFNSKFIYIITLLHNTFTLISLSFKYIWINTLLCKGCTCMLLSSILLSSIGTWTRSKENVTYFREINDKKYQFLMTSYDKLYFLYKQPSSKKIMFRCQKNQGISTDSIFF